MSGTPRAYRDAAHQRALWAAWALALNGKPLDLAELRRVLDREQLVRALERHRDRGPRIGDWLERLEYQRGGIGDSDGRGLDRSLGRTTGWRSGAGLAAHLSRSATPRRCARDQRTGAVQPGRRLASTMSLYVLSNAATAPC